MLGREPETGDDGAVVALDGGEVRFVAPRDDRGEGICEVEVAMPQGGERLTSLGGVDLVLRPIGG